MCVLKGLVSECFWFDIGYRNLKWFLVPNEVEDLGVRGVMGWGEGKIFTGRICLVDPCNGAK